MKKLVEEQVILDCISEGINTASEIAKKLNFDVGYIYNFCKYHKIKLIRSKSGGHNFVDMTGQVINKIKIISIDKRINKKVYWKCICPCGKEFVAYGADIRNNRTKTCGCRVSIVSKRNWQGFGNIPKLLWSTLIRNSENRGLELKVSIEFLDELIKKQDFKCALSGIKLMFSKRGCTASLDRIDSSKGYLEDNVQWVHKDINWMKQEYDEKYYYEMCKQVYLNSKDKYESNTGNES